MKALDEVKEELAHEYGFKSWRDMYLYTDLPGDALIDEVAKRYAAEALKEAIERLAFGGANRNMIVDLINELK